MKCCARELLSSTSQIKFKEDRFCGSKASELLSVADHVLFTSTVIATQTSDF